MAAGAGAHSREESFEERSEVVASMGASAEEALSPNGDSQDEVQMVRRATEVLGLEHVAHWMRSKISSLGNRTPDELIQTEDGRKQVERVLLKIQHGVY